jgi:hypothetical protein
MGSADIAGSLRHQPLLRARNVAVDTGWPQHVRREGREDAWDSGAPTELLGLGDTLEQPGRLLTEPLNGRPDVTMAVPSAPLEPGGYELALGFGLLGTPTFRFEVGPGDQARAAKCVDASYRYTVNISGGHATFCEAPSASSAEAALSHVRYSLTQDLVIRANGEALKAAATGGATLSVSVPGVMKGMVASRITSLRSWLLGMAPLPLKDGVSDWDEVARTAPRPAAPAFDVQALPALRRLYSEVQVLALPSAVLANAVLPKSWDDLVDRVLASFSSQVLAHPEVFSPADATAAVTFKHLLGAQRVVANAIAPVPDLRPYSDNLNLVLRLRESEDRAIAQVASAAADACPAASPEGVPILPYVQREAHPFEGATYRAWVARSPLRMHEEPREASRVLVEIAAASQVVAETGETHTVTYGRIVVERQRRVTASLSVHPGHGDLASYGRGSPLQLTLAPGATLLSVGCYGEGACGVPSSQQQRAVTDDPG